MFYSQMFVVNPTTSLISTQDVAFSFFFHGPDTSAGMECKEVHLLKYCYFNRNLRYSCVSIFFYSTTFIGYF